MKTLHIIGPLLLIAVLAPEALGSGEVPIVRAIYGPWNYTQDERVGLDTDYDNSWWTFGSTRILDKFAKNSIDAASHGITYIAGLYYLGDVAPFNYTRAVSELGQKQIHTPSTVDETYWFRLMEEPALAVANLSLHYPIWGLVWDFELYLANDGWEAGSYSYDAPALEAFGDAKGIEIPQLPPEQRHSWLKSQGHLSDFLRWQEEVVYEMAKRTEEGVHEINPNFTLGILGFSDSWRYWLTLEAFSTPRAPVTVWTEDTYPGYDEERIDYLQGILDKRGLNGMILPGLYTVALGPWRLLEEMERAIRHSGAFWIYQHNGDAYRHADEVTYSRTYEVFDEFIFFKGTEADPLPAFTLHPGVDARPYKGPGSVSLLLKPKVGVAFADDLEILTDSTDLVYVGENLSAISLDGPNLSYADLPCIIGGLNQEDLALSEAWSMLRELRTIVGYYNSLGYERMVGMETAIQESSNDLSAGRIDEIITRLGKIIEAVYGEMLDSVWPDVEEAKKNPRDSPIPIPSLSRISSARRMYEEDKISEGNAYLLDGLRQWSQAVNEGIAALAVLTFAAFLVPRRASPWSGTSSRPGAWAPEA